MTDRRVRCCRKAHHVARTRTVKAVLAGMLCWLSLPPRGWWPLAIAGTATLASALDGAWRSRMLLGFTAGLAWFAPAFVWVTDLSTPGWVTLVVVEAAIVAVAGVLVPPGPERYIALPAVVVLLEAARARVPLGGLPLAGLALGQVDGPLLPIARLGGPLAIVAVVATLGCAAIGLLDTAHRRGATAALALTAIVITTAQLFARPGSPDALIDVAAVQGGGSLGTHAIDTDEREVTRRHLAASAQVPVGTELVIWPEDVIDLPTAFAGSPTARRIGDLAQTLGAPIVVGVIEPAGPDAFHNAAVVVAPTGAVEDRYDKVHRVPFGEYIPARNQLGGIFDLSRVPRDAIAGTGPGLVRIGDRRVGVAISFEVFFAERTRAAVRAGAELLVVPTNASSYRRSTPAYETLTAARLRAVETGRDLVQAAPTGFSALIDARGRVIRRSDLTRQQVVSGTLALRSDRTPYVVAGDLPIIVVAIIVLGAAWLSNAHLRERRRHSPRVSPRR
jgi:apolipoprotein N-acyltransferase